MRCSRPSIAARGFFARTLTMLGLGLAAAQANAFVMDMEGFAPPGGNTDELTVTGGTSIQGSFSLTVEHGHYWSATNSYTWAQSDIGGTATDWFLHDFDTPLHIEEVGGNPFSVSSFQAGEWFGPGTPFHTISTTGNPIEVTGFLSGGGTITSTFTSDSIPSDGPGPNVDF